MSGKPFRRKDLKHDEFITVAGRAGRWLMERRRRIGWGLLAIALGVSVVLSVRLVHQRDEQRAAALLAAAMDVYRAPVIPPLPEAVVTPIADETGPAEGEIAETDSEPPADVAAAQEEAGGGDPTATARPVDAVDTNEGEIVDPPPPNVPERIGLQFETNDEKYRAALERFAPIVERYSGRPSGRVAAFYLGICHSELGDTDSAVAALTQAADASEPLISSMALYRLGQLELEVGNSEAAVTYFDRLVDDDDSLFPLEEALMAKARAHEEAGDPRAALAAYQRVLNEFAASYSEVEARARVEELSAELGLDPNVEGD